MNTQLLRQQDGISMFAARERLTVDDLRSPMDIGHDEHGPSDGLRGTPLRRAFRHCLFPSLLPLGDETTDHRDRDLEQESEKGGEEETQQLRVAERRPDAFGAIFHWHARL